MSDAIPEELWTAKSTELQEELRRVRTEMDRHDTASEADEAAGLQILELAQRPIRRMLRKIRKNRRVS